MGGRAHRSYSPLCSSFTWIEFFSSWVAAAISSRAQRLGFTRDPVSGEALSSEGPISCLAVTCVYPLAAREP